MTEHQKKVLQAAVDLVQGGLDTRESSGCYRVISDYVLNSIPPDAETKLSQPTPPPTRRQLSLLAEQFFPGDSGWREEEIEFARAVLERWGNCNQPKEPENSSKNC